MRVVVCSAYCFKELRTPEAESCKRDLEALAETHGILGLILLSAEGINGTVSADEEGAGKFKNFIKERFSAEDGAFKIHYTESHPFNRFKVQVRQELVTLSDKHAAVEKLTPLALQAPLPQLEADEWDAFIDSGREHTLIDVRNWYETKCGKFPGAVDPKTSSFGEFPAWVKNAGLDKKKPVLMYCTGGIRCEKAAILMRNEGFEEVYQLKGGILRYFEAATRNSFEGECFVFDHRVAVDAKLSPSERFRLCPHCGNPGERKISCSNCGKHAQVCENCQWPKDSSCSKNCAYHLKIRAKSGSQALSRASASR